MLWCPGEDRIVPQYGVTWKALADDIPNLPTEVQRIQAANELELLARTPRFRMLDQFTTPDLDRTQHDALFLRAGRGSGKSAAVHSIVEASVYEPSSVPEHGLKYVGDGASVCLVGLTDRETVAIMIRPLIARFKQLDILARANLSANVLELTNGITIHWYGCTAVEALRGGNHTLLCCEETASWPTLEGLENALLATRVSYPDGTSPLVVHASTPRIRKEIAAMILDPRTLSKGATIMGNPYISDDAKQQMLSRYPNKSSVRWRQEVLGELVLANPEALFEDYQLQTPDPDAVIQFERVIISVDPSLTAATRSRRRDDTGILVCGRTSDGQFHVIADATNSDGPDDLLTHIDRLHAQYPSADVCLTESNAGGQFIDALIRVRPLPAGLRHVPVRANTSKVSRLEPLAVAAEQMKVWVHDGCDEFVSEALQFNPNDPGARSPNRLDAASQAFTYLMRSKASTATVVGNLAPTPVVKIDTKRSTSAWCPGDQLAA